MAEIVIVGITMGLIVIVSALYKGRRRRVNLLRITCVALFVATFCRGMEPPIDGPAVDLIKRIAILTAQASVALLILTFRATPLSERTTRFVYFFTGLVALGETVLVWFIPVHADGTLYHRTDIDDALAQGRAWALVSYNFLYLSAFAAATIVVAVGCWSTMTQRNQPFAARLPVAFVFSGAIGSALFIGSSLLDLFGHAVLGGSEVRTQLLVAVVSFFFIGLATGVIRRISIEVRKKLALRLAHEVVVPLWRTTTTLHPDVRLPPEDQQEFDQLMTLSRLTIETHDALRLIREDDDPALEPLHKQHPEDPDLSAGLVRHLSGENSVPRLGWFTVALSRLRTLRLKDDENLATSVQSLYEIRVAVSAMNEQDSR
ncbi:hypothetical protein [Pseudarthrobacter sp. GA104]|uniref:hypothetical protein n=1 Tax=Pseudarthrobacter sp. GA104 TaxID=2676311 RepID=UPI0012FA2E17|nr:hypothetical protein [Pseudarthrobacter sp. GA104]MUU73463.1 hypothetical protein [Pseudarthrobacter sp. GA104]